MANEPLFRKGKFPAEPATPVRGTWGVGIWDFKTGEIAAPRRSVRISFFIV